jgi:hypothetical protein
MELKPGFYFGPESGGMTLAEINALNPGENTMKVVPAPGRAVRDPRSMMLLPDEGRDVPDDDPFWNRRLRDGDVTIAAPPPEQQKAASAHQPRKET